MKINLVFIIKCFSINIELSAPISAMNETKLKIRNYLLRRIVNENITIPSSNVSASTFLVPSTQAS